MNKKIASLTMGTLLVSCFFVLPAVAQQQESEATTSQQPDTARQERIETYKSQVSENLTEVQQRRVANRCQAAQQKLVTLQTVFTRRVDARSAVYDRITNRIENVIASFEGSVVDASKLQTALADLQAERLLLETRLDELNTTLVDVSEIDCVNDTDGFQAALSVTRDSYNQAKVQALEIRNFITNDIKSLLQDARSQLEVVTEG